MGCSHVYPGHWVGVFSLFAGFSLCLAAVASPLWRIIEDTSSRTVNEGLWQYCDTAREDAGLPRCATSLKTSVLFRIMQILKILALLLLFTTFVCSFLPNYFRQTKHPKLADLKRCPFSAIGAFAGGILMLVTDMMYVGYMEGQTSDLRPGEVFYAWSFGISVTGWILALLAAVIIFVSARIGLPRYVSQSAQPYLSGHASADVGAAMTSFNYFAHPVSPLNRVLPSVPIDRQNGNVLDAPNRMGWTSGAAEKRRLYERSSRNLGRDQEDRSGYYRGSDDKARLQTEGLGRDYPEKFQVAGIRYEGTSLNGGRGYGGRELREGESRIAAERPGNPDYEDDVSGCVSCMPSSQHDQKILIGKSPPSDNDDDVSDCGPCFSSRHGKDAHRMKFPPRVYAGSSVKDLAGFPRLVLVDERRLFPDRLKDRYTSPVDPGGFAAEGPDRHGSFQEWLYPIVNAKNLPPGYVKVREHIELRKEDTGEALGRGVRDRRGGWQDARDAAAGEEVHRILGGNIKRLSSNSTKRRPSREVILTPVPDYDRDSTDDDEDKDAKAKARRSRSAGSAWRDSGLGSPTVEFPYPPRTSSAPPGSVRFHGTQPKATDHTEKRDRYGRWDGDQNAGPENDRQEERRDGGEIRRREEGKRREDDKARDGDERRRKDDERAREKEDGRKGDNQRPRRKVPKDDDDDVEELLGRTYVYSPTHKAYRDRAGQPRPPPRRPRDDRRDSGPDRRVWRRRRRSSLPDSMYLPPRGTSYGPPPYYSRQRPGPYPPVGPWSMIFINPKKEKLVIRPRRGSFGL